jgi:hypothetical protein
LSNSKKDTSQKRGGFTRKGLVLKAGPEGFTLKGKYNKRGGEKYAEIQFSGFQDYREESDVSILSAKKDQRLGIVFDKCQG